MNRYLSLVGGDVDRRWSQNDFNDLSSAVLSSLERES